MSPTERVSAADERAAPPATDRPVRRQVPPLPADQPRYHRLRKTVHLVCFLVFVALPFSNVFRFDIPRQRFHFFGFELWISEFGILFFALMFLMFLVVVAAVFYGRFYCGYLCPQMIFSEASIALENRLKRAIGKRLTGWSTRCGTLAVRAALYAILGIASVLLAFVFISYFVEPADLFRRLLSLDLRTAGGIAGASVTVITFLDFAFVRQKFCTTICPYGYLQGMLVDGNTLLVHYRDQGHECIECKKCVRVCHMGIDIRTSPYQIECIHCGECIDACTEIMGKIGKRGLIHYTWGESGETLTDKTGRWYRRAGLRDAKRVVVMLVLIFYASGLFVALSMRHSLMVRITPERSSLYRLTVDGRVANRFRINAANRSNRSASVSLAIEGLPGAMLEMKANPLQLQASQQVQEEFEISVRRFPGAEEVNHFIVRAGMDPDHADERFEMTFLMPPEKRSK